MSYETMSDFFAARVEGYDEHMLENVGGCKEGYKKLATLIPKETIKLLDLGCGTGLELDEIFKILPDIEVTGIDLTKAMLDRLRAKHPDKALTLIHGSYFKYDLGIEQYDVAISFQTMHHFAHEDKVQLYKKIYTSLKPGGKYIECDYMVESQEEEDHWYSRNAQIRRELHIPKGVFYHYDTPCTIVNQKKLFQLAEFSQVKNLWRKENTTIMIGEKKKSNI